MEILDIYDKDGNLTGKTTPRGNKNLQDGEFIKLATVWIKSHNKWLIQKCSLEKGGEYAVTGGHVPTGITSIEQAKVETLEELGLDIDVKKLKLLGSITRGHAIFDAFIYQDDNIYNYPFVFQQEEVDDCQWLSNEEINNLISKQLLRPSTQEQFEKLIVPLD